MQIPTLTYKKLLVLYVYVVAPTFCRFTTRCNVRVMSVMHWIFGPVFGSACLTRSNWQDEARATGDFYTVLSSAPRVHAGCPGLTRASSARSFASSESGRDRGSSKTGPKGQNPQRSIAAFVGREHFDQLGKDKKRNSGADKSWQKAS